MDTDLDTLATALYVTCDDLLSSTPSGYRASCDRVTPAISDAELITLAVMQALLGYTSEPGGCATRPTCGRLFPYLPGQSGYNKRLRKLAARWPG